MALVPCYRGSVNAWECDENDHLNVRYYLAKANQGLPFLLDASGLSSSTLREQAGRPRVRAQHIRFLSESRPATPLTVMAGLAHEDTRHLTVYSEMRHSLTGSVLAAVLTELELTGPEGRLRSIAVSGNAPRCTVPEYGSPRGIPAGPEALRPVYDEIAPMGFVEIGRGTIAASECDANGELEPFQYVGRMADSVVNLLARFQTEEELSRRSAGLEGGALVELRITFHAPLRSGSCFTIHSGVAAVARKTQHFVHLFFDEASHGCVATARGVAVPMDLKARKAIELPEPRRRRIEAGLLRLPR